MPDLIQKTVPHETSYLISDSVWGIFSNISTKNMLTRKHGSIKPRIKRIVMVNHIHVAIHQKIAVEIGSISIVNQFVKMKNLREHRLVNMRSIFFRIENVLAVLNIQRSKYILIAFSHKFGDAFTVRQLPLIEQTNIKLENLKRRNRQSDFAGQSCTNPFGNQRTDSRMVALAPSDSAAIIIAEIRLRHSLFGNLQYGRDHSHGKIVPQQLRDCKAGTS